MKHVLVRSRPDFKKQLRLYSLILLIATTAVAIAICVNQIFSYEREIDRIQNQSINQAQELTEKYQTSANDFALDLTQNNETILHLNNYFNLNTEKYLNYALDNQGRGFIYIPSMISRAFTNNDLMQQMIISINDSRKVMIANSSDKSGTFVNKLPKLNGDFVFSAPLRNELTLQNIGTVSLEYKHERIDAMLDQTTGNANSELYIFSNDGQLKYHHSGIKNYQTPKLDLDKITKIMASGRDYSLKDFLGNNYIGRVMTSNSGDVIVAGTSKASIWHFSIKTVGIVFIAWLLVSVGLVYILLRTFNSYQKQLNSILETMTAIDNGNFDSRIPQTGNQEDLVQITDGINQMLDRVKKYIDEIYVLEIAQKDANMRALQAQINPHFLYNTLEYIRMYALSLDADELADVVYNFATLLRNNISQDSISTISSEFDFAEKYIYLYQMRYPKKIAYSINLEPDIAMESMPKFILQPIVENFFTHGIDLTSSDNAIKLAAKKIDDNMISIEVVNNGAPIEAKKLQQLNNALASGGTYNFNNDHSIGLQNVNERMRGYFDKDYHMLIENNEYGGVTVRMVFKQEGKHDTNNPG